MFQTQTYIYTNSKVIKADPNHKWVIAFDGSSDREKMPVDITMIMSPEPLIASVEDYEGKAFYGTEAHKEHIDSVVTDIRKNVDEEFAMISMITDDEETMRSLRRLSVNEGIFGPGCVSHGVNITQGLHFKWMLINQH